MTTKNVQYQGTGRRKTSTARAYMTPGTGEIKINGVLLDDYLPLDTLKMVVRSPFEVTETTNQFDVSLNVKGGGYNGQAGAVRHAISRALLTVSSDYRASLKSAGFLTRDSRKKEREKYGLRGARKAPQYSKR